MILLMKPVILLVYVLLSVAAGYAGRNRRIGFWGFLFLSLLVTPFLTGLLIFGAAPVVPAPRQGRTR